MQPKPRCPIKRFISFGAGTQSTYLLLRGLEGFFGDIPDGAIFADTQNEPAHVYEWLARIESLVAPFPIHRVTAGDLGSAYIGGVRRAAIPVSSLSAEGKPMMMKRFCSDTFKVRPVRRKIRELVGMRGTAECWIGISTDEAHRGFKSTGLKWLSNRYPLLDAGVSRMECVAYIERTVGVKPPRSSCIWCPFHGDRQWLEIKRNDPQGFEKSCQFDEAIRNLDRDRWSRPRYLHRSLRPLRQVEFKHENQFTFADGFGNECEGMCGL